MQTGVRFAPSPTGRFHIGNLRTAWIAQWWAKTLHEELVIRSEDIDQPRNVVGAHELQIADLKKLAIIPDGVAIQSVRRHRHWELFSEAHRQGVIYPCTCSRKDVQTALSALASAPHTGVNEPGSVYSGTCRNVSPSVTAGAPIANPGPIAWRFRDQDSSGRNDFIVGRTGKKILDAESFVPAYHWACAIDDWEGNYRLLVRAWDLATAVPIQRSLQAWLGNLRSPSRPIIFPAVFHTSLVTQADGHRLEKRTPGVTLGEIIKSGISSAEIIKRFENSFSALSSEFLAGKIWGERVKERSLAEIGF